MVFYVVQTLNFGSEQRSAGFFGHLAGYPLFPITSSRVNRLDSFLNLMLISSSDTNCVKEVYFCCAVLEKLASKLALGLNPRTG